MSNIYSNATNFSSFMNGSVDLRTGQYSAVMKLCTLHALFDSESSRDISLTYSLMNTLNTGFGIGWSLSGLSGCSTTDNMHWTLRLADGRTFQIDGFYSDILTFKDKKLDDFFVTRVDDWVLSVVYKNGTVETLERFSDGGPYYMTAVAFENGESYTFTYGSASGFDGLLETITDMDDKVLLSLTYDGLWVDSCRIQTDSGRTAEVGIAFMAGQLEQMTVPGETLNWDDMTCFVYEAVGSYSALKEVHSPMGSVQRVCYDATGHRIDEKDYLPNVVRWEVEPGGGQPPVVRIYNYSDRNFLGYEDGMSHEYGADNLYRHIGDYNYWAQETLVDSDEQILSTREATFNKYHLATQEILTDQGCQVTTDTVYNEEPGRDFYGQPANLQLPRKVTTTYSQGGASRSEVTVSKTDKFGNVTFSQDSTDLAVTNTYYLAAGESGCPPEPFGYFVRYLQRSSQSCSTEDEKVWDYEYVSLKVSSDQGNGTLVLENKVTYSSGASVKVMETTYLEQTASRLHALPLSQGVTINGCTTRERYDYTLNAGLLMMVTTFEGDDGVSVQTSEHSDVIQSVVLSHIDVEGRTESREYDVQGRPVKVTFAPGSEYEVSELAQYVFARDGAMAKAIVTNRWGVSERVEFDGLGRMVSVSIQDDDATSDCDGRCTGTYRQITSKQYNQVGRLVQEVESDYLDGKEVIRRQQDHTYDGWGQISTTVYDDGVIDISVYDPVALTLTQGMKNSAGSALASRRLTYNQFKKPEKIEELDAKGEVYATISAVYDGFGRPKSVTMADGGQLAIKAYDGFDRPEKVEHLDGSLHDLTYFTASSEMQLSRIDALRDGAVPVTLGTREFDGIGRITSQSVNGVSRQYRYHTGSMLLSSQTNARGQTVACKRLVELERIASVDMTGNGAPEVNFTYSKTSDSTLPAGLVTQATSATGGYEYIYSRRGNLTEVIQTAQSQAQSYQVGYGAFLLRGGASEVTAGERIVSRSYNLLGQVTESRDDAVTVSNQYDSFGRLSVMSVSEDGQLVQSTTLTYDEFSRETQRKITAQEHTLTIGSAYDTLHKMISRSVSTGCGESLRESYRYDVRHRLTGYNISADSSESLLPKNEYGRAISSQALEYDDLNNLIKQSTFFPSGECDEAILTYDVQRLLGVSHSLLTGDNAYPQKTVLDYDKDGNLVSVTDDGVARHHFAFNALGSVVQCDDVAYGYDPYGQLLSSGETVRYYQGDQVMSEHSPTGERRFVSQGKTTIAEITAGETRWLQSDAKGSVVGVLEGSRWTYSPYTPSGEGQGLSRTGFNGELRDSVANSAYPLGNGTRWYLPGLGQFSGMDVLSPFGEGGLNPYRYCHGDPVNLADPSGHMSVGAIIGNVIGVIGAVAGIVMAIPTGGASLTLTAGADIMLGATELTATVTSIGLSAAGDEKGAEIAGGIATLAGLGSMGRGIKAHVSGGSPRVRLHKWSTTEMSADLLDKKAGTRDPMGYTNNFKGTGEEAILLHGSPDGKVQVGAWPRRLKKGGWEVDDSHALSLSGKELPKYMKRHHGIDLYQGNKPVHLLACYAKSNTAQDLATEIGRPVIAYSKQPIWTPSLSHIESPNYSIGAEYRKYDPRRLFSVTHQPKAREFV